MNYNSNIFNFNKNARKIVKKKYEGGEILYLVETNQNTFQWLRENDIPSHFIV